MNIEAVKSALINLAIRGKLVPQRADEPAVEQNGEAPEKAPFEIPAKWKWAKISSTCSSLVYGTAKKSQATGAVPVIRMGNLQDGKIDWGDLVYSSDAPDIKKFMLHRGDVLFNRTNSRELVGKTSIYDSDRPAIFAGYLIRLNYDKNLITGSFLNFVMNSTLAKDYCAAVRSNGVGQANISAKKIGNFFFPLPPLAEQRRIVAKLEELLEPLSRVQERLGSLTHDFPEQFKAAVLQKAIQGKLVPQRDDEPAVEQIGEAPKEAPFEIPAKWKWEKLESVATLIAGQSPDGDAISGDPPGIEFHQGKIHFNEVFLGQSNRFASAEKLKIAPKNSLLLSVRAPVGDVNITPRTVCIGRGLHCLLPNEKTIDLKFLFYAQKARAKDLKALSTGTTFKAVSGTVVKNFLIPLPPLAEQRRIVAKAEQLFSQVDELTARLSS